MTARLACGGHHPDLQQQKLDRIQNYGSELMPV